MIRNFSWPCTEGRKNLTYKTLSRISHGHGVFLFKITLYQKYWLNKIATYLIHIHNNESIVQSRLQEFLIFHYVAKNVKKYLAHNVIKTNDMAIRKISDYHFCSVTQVFYKCIYLFCNLAKFCDSQQYIQLSLHLPVVI